jgi:hypothetical protein
MKNLFCLLILMGATTAHSHNEKYDELFSTKNNKTETMSIRWVPVTYVVKECNAAAIKVGSKPYGENVITCSFWDSAFNSCTIITEKDLSMYSLAYAIRTCYQGASWTNADK